jgi:hypothetical protein
MHKRHHNNTKKRTLDLESLASNRYGVVAAIETQWPAHPVKHSTAIQQMRQAFADLKRIRPEVANCEVVIDLPPTLRFKLVVPSMTQGALDINGAVVSSSKTGGATTVEDVFANHCGDRNAVFSSKDVSSTPNGGPSRTLEATALAEADQLAAIAAKVSLSAVDVGGNVVRQVKNGNVSLEAAIEEFAKSPDEKVSRQSYARAAGPSQTIQYAQLGERTLGGRHIVSADLHSSDTFSLKCCRILPGGRDGGFYLEGNPNDPEWNRLSANHPNCNLLSGDKDGYVMQLLGYALASYLPVDIDICLSERIKNRRRRLVPLLVRNRSEIIGGVRDRLELLEEEYQ